MTLNRLLNADNECVGYFTDDAAGRAAMQAARVEWNRHYSGRLALDAAAMVHAPGPWCRSIATPIEPLELEDVEPGDNEQTDYVFNPLCEETVWRRVSDDWLDNGAASVDVRHHEINRYRRPGKSHRSADLGGPEQAADVLYVLTIKAPIVQRLCK